MITVTRTSAEGRVLEILLQKQPLDFDGLLRETGFRRDRLELLVARLCGKKIVAVGCYPERYMTLLRSDIEFTGTRRQHKTLKTDKSAKGKSSFEGRGYG